jgi:hypothetical protein
MRHARGLELRLARRKQLRESLLSPAAGRAGEVFLIKFTLQNTGTTNILIRLIDDRLAIEYGFLTSKPLRVNLCRSNRMRTWEAA